MVKLRNARSIRINNEVSIYDLLEQETVDRLYDQVTNQKNNRKSAGSFSLPDFRAEIPLEPTFGKSKVGVLRIRPKGRNAKEIFAALIWTALFGSKRFTMIHWYLIYHLFEKQIRKDNRSLALLRILRITTERSGQSFNQKLKPIKTIVQNVLGKEQAIRYCLNLAKDLGIKLPEKDPKLNDLLRVETGWKFQRRPEPERRIGVGYKDKGSLPKGPKEDTECSEDYLVLVGDLFADLLESTNDCIIFTSSYDPKKHQKLLTQVQSKIKN
jgi:hypothetical protein